MYLKTYHTIGYPVGLQVMLRYGEDSALTIAGKEQQSRKTHLLKDIVTVTFRHI